MGCGCGGGARRNSRRSAKPGTRRRSVANQSVQAQASLKAQKVKATPRQSTQANAKKAQAFQPNQSPRLKGLGMNAERRRIEKMRRDAVAKALGK